MSSALQKLAPLVSRITRQGAKSGRQTRSYAADAHGEVKLNCWETKNISQWKEEHIVFAVLAGWGIGITSAMKIFGGKKGEAPPADAAA